MHAPGKGATILVVAALLAAASASVAVAQAGNGADVSATLRFVGHGKAKARLGQLVRLAFTVTNAGPATATGVEISGNGSDHFNVISTTCTDGAAEVACPGELAPGETVTGKVVLQVCCFPPGETRRAFGYVVVGTATPDPNPDDNQSLTDIRIIGPHGELL